MIFTEFELTSEGKKHKKMMCSYNDNYFRRDLHVKYVIRNSSAVTLKSVAIRAKKKTRRAITNVSVWWTPLFFVVCLHFAIGDDLQRRFWERTFA